jgi:SAM-dependent methyltransferase
MWNDAAGYEAYVGRWSRLIAPQFLEWIGVADGVKWLDVACGTGAVTRAILDRSKPAEIAAIDGSREYLARAAADCADPRVRFECGSATALSCPSGHFDAAVSGLALNFMPFDRALAEQKRVLRPGGTAGAYIWDYAGEYEFARRFWDAAISVDPRAAAHDPGRTCAICSTEALTLAFAAAGFDQVETRAFDARDAFPSRAAYWACFDVPQGSTAKYLSLLSAAERDQLRDALFASMSADGPVQLKVRALAVKGIRA